MSMKPHSLPVFFLLALVVRGQQQCGEGNPDCPTGSSCHPTENVCYDDPEPVMGGRPYVWLGLAPSECSRQPPDCEFFDLDFDIRHKRGDEGMEWCDSGDKVRCLYKDVTPPPTPTPANTIQVMTYNIFERAFFISYDGQKERTCRLVRDLFEGWRDVDVISFQETFMGGCWPEQLSIRDILTYHGWPYSTTTVDDPDKAEPGGIFIASRWPILEEDQFVYESADPDSWDWFSAKGVSYAKIQKEVGGTSQVYHVMGTHMQAGSRSLPVRVNQTMEWANFVQGKNLPDSEPVIYVGDFNADFYTQIDHLTEILSILKADIPERIGWMNGTSDHCINDLYEGCSRPAKWIDWVVHGTNHLLPTAATIEALYPHRPDNCFDVCWCKGCPGLQDYMYPDDPDCDVVRCLEHLSDHFPALGTFTFP